MPYRPNFPIPENIDPPKRCIQLCIPDDPTYMSVFAGLIYELTYWFNWERTDGNEGAQCANVWKEIYNSTDWSIMSCCCPEQEPFVIRITPEGVYQRSTDGGTTWTDSPQDDPRFTQPVYPPFLPPDTVAADCTYADSIVQVIKVNMVDTLEEGQNASAIIGVIVSALVGVLAVLAVSVIGAIVVAVLGGIAVAIAGASIPAFKAAMTTDVYNRLRCNLQSHMSSDGSFTQEQIDAIYAQIGTDETGIAALFLQGVIAAAGVVGLTNMARSGLGAPDAECSCGACASEWSVANIDGATAYGTLISRDGDTYVFEGQVAFDSLYYLTIKTPSAEDCCSVMSMTATEGHSMPSGGTAGSRIVCPNPQTGTAVTGGSITYEVGSLNYIGIQSTVPFQVEMVFG